MINCRHEDFDWWKVNNIKGTATILTNDEQRKDLQLKIKQNCGVHKIFVGRRS